MEENEEKNEKQWLGKTNFVEIRSFWQIFRSFDRMWSFYILSLQVCFKYNDDIYSLQISVSYDG